MKLVTRHGIYHILLALINVTGIFWLSVKGQIPINRTTYFQDFNVLISSGSSSILPEGWVFSETGTNADTFYIAGDGSGTTGDTHSFGLTSSSDRSLGSLRSGNLNSVLGASFINSTGNTINEITIEYTGEQWRIGNLSREDRLNFQYSINATSLSDGTWTNFDLLDFIAPNTTGTIGALDGNLSTNKTNIIATLTGLNIPLGNTIWIRWLDFDATGADDGLGVDDFYLTANAICDAEILGFAPASGPAGTLVSITGVNLTGTTAVYFNKILSPSFAINSATSITATVPEGSSSGPITVFSNCIAASNGSFSILRYCCTTGATNLFISGYVEGSSFNKAIEIANFTGSTINLSGYRLEGYFNGNSSPITLATLPNVDLTNNQVWVVVPANASPALRVYANQTSVVPVWFNGNDALVLMKDAGYVDIFGNTGCDPGTEWIDGGIKTKDVTLVRKSNVINGISTDPPACTFPTLSTEWDPYQIDDYSHLGSHTVIYSATPPLITSQPANKTVCVGESTTLSTIATDTISYQWKWLNGGIWQDVIDLPGRYQGSTTDTLTITASADLNGIQYYCEVYSTGQCFTASHAVQLTVNPLPSTSFIFHQ